jgi:Lipopolysaccharide-assembly
MVIVLSACGYRAEGGRSGHVTTITVPYVQGDAEGELTDQLIKQLSASGRFEVVQRGGCLCLNVSLIDNSSERIGYQYSRDDTKRKLHKNLLATENRRLVTAEVTLVNTVSEEILLGPSLVKASAEYDYIDSGSLRDLTFINSQGKKEKTLTFSLGQLDSIEGAQDDAAVPLYRALAQKIVDGVCISTR